jgi:UDP-N-acetylglucosamine 2-epimerase (non-hydrolysing)
MRHTVLCVVGARPNFVKIAPIVRALAGRERFTARLVHTGQHHDRQLSQVFFDELAIPAPHVSLDVGSGTQAQQTAEIMRRLEPVLQAEQPHVVLVVGDVTSTVASALTASKFLRAAPFDWTGQRQRRRPLVAHVEAGLRSFDDDMPEEINRRVTDSVSDLLFVSEPSGVDNLRREGVADARVHFVGNVMIDTLLAARDRASRTTILEDLGLAPGGYGLVTLHRPSNVDDPAQLAALLGVLDDVAARVPLVFPVHPRTRAALAAAGIHLAPGRWQVIDAVGYLEFLRLTSAARLVLTDSGGIQEETTVLGVRCLTLRENTERPVTITEGTNLLAGTRRETIWPAFERALVEPCSDRRPALWDGSAAQRIADVLALALPGADG